MDSPEVPDGAPAPLGYDYFADASGARSLAHSSEVGIRFQSQRRALERLAQSMRQMPGRLQLLLERGMTLPDDLSPEVSRLTQRLAQATERAEEEMQRAHSRLLPEIEALLAQVQANDETIAESDYDSNAAAIVTAKAQADQVRLRVEAAEADVLATFGEVSNAVRLLEKRLHALEGAVERLRSSAITLQSGEALLEAAPAQLYLGRGEAQTGTLFLTDRRLLFEQKEEVVRRARFLPLPRREQVQQVTLDIPRGAVAGATVARPLGSLFAGPSLNLRLAPPQPAPEVQLDLRGAEATWLALLGGELEER